MKPIWRLIGVPQASVLGPVFFNVIINGLDDGAKCVCSMLATRCEVADMPEGGTTPCTGYLLRTTWLEMRLVEKDLAVCSCGRGHVVSWSTLNIASRLREVILPFCPTLMKPDLDFCILFWTP